MALSMISRGSRGSSKRMYSMMASATQYSNNDSTNWVVPAVIGGALLGAYSLSQKVHAEEALHPPPLPWTHDPKLGAFDTASLRRGFEVYRQVCSTCHSLQFISFRNLVGVTHTEAQAKALAASYKIRDGPDSKGEYFMRPRILSDPLPRPYDNEEQARDANGGALPPDLSLIAKARHGGQD
jgi:ubiquinol-cytochrome c reductase cytochrome c1 subunit